MSDFEQFFALTNTPEAAAYFRAAAARLRGLYKVDVVTGADDEAVNKAGAMYAGAAHANSWPGSDLTWSGNNPSETRPLPGASPDHDPKKYQQTAEDILRRGGALVAITVEKGVGTSQLYDLVNQLRREAGEQADE